jgi:hypothetical protein
VSIEKFALSECKALIKTHAAFLYQWCEGSQGKVHPQVKEGLLEITARLYEVLEGLPEADVPTSKTTWPNEEKTSS